MNTVAWKQKAIVRQKLLRSLREKVAKIPEPFPNGAWLKCCTELREIEIALDRAGMLL